MTRESDNCVTQSGIAKLEVIAKIARALKLRSRQVRLKLRSLINERLVVAAICKNQETRLCSRCGQVSPIDHFRRVRRDRDDLRHSMCRTCRNRHHRTRRLLKRRQRLSKALTALRRTRDPTRLEVLASSLLTACGGTTRLVKLARECVADPKRSGFKSQLVCALIDLLEKLDDQHQQSPHDRFNVYEEMSDLELESAFSRYLKKALKDEPEIAAGQLRRLGWTVEPPVQMFRDGSANRAK